MPKKSVKEKMPVAKAKSKKSAVKPKALTAKPSVTVTKGSIPENKILLAQFPPNEIMTGQFPSRYSKRVGTGVHIETSPGFKVCIQLLPDLTERGMVLANAPGYFESGEIYLDLVNAGKEIVNVRHNDPVCRVFVQRVDEDVL